MQYWEKLKPLRVLYESYAAPIRKKYNLTQMEMDILLFLKNNPEYDTAADIVKKRQLAKSHVSTSVKHLIELKYLDYTYTENNRKSVHLRLNESAQVIARDGLRMQENYGKQLMDGFSEEEIREFENLFSKLCINAEIALGER